MASAATTIEVTFLAIDRARATPTNNASSSAPPESARELRPMRFNGANASDEFCLATMAQSKFVPSSSFRPNGEYEARTSTPR
jgi:hypothetical protein